MGRIRELLNVVALKAETKMKSERLIKDKCNLTRFMIRFIEEWPESFGSAVDTVS